MYNMTVQQWRKVCSSASICICICVCVFYLYLYFWLYLLQACNVVGCYKDSAAKAGEDSQQSLLPGRFHARQKNTFFCIFLNFLQFVQLYLWQPDHQIYQNYQKSIIFSEEAKTSNAWCASLNILQDQCKLCKNRRKSRVKKMCVCDTHVPSCMLLVAGSEECWGA